MRDLREIYNVGLYNLFKGNINVITNIVDEFNLPKNNLIKNSGETIEKLQTLIEFCQDSIELLKLVQEEDDGLVRLFNDRKTYVGVSKNNALQTTK